MAVMAQNMLFFYCGPSNEMCSICACANCNFFNTTHNLLTNFHRGKIIPSIFSTFWQDEVETYLKRNLP